MQVFQRPISRTAHHKRPISPTLPRCSSTSSARVEKLTSRRGIRPESPRGQGPKSPRRKCPGHPPSWLRAIRPENATSINGSLSIYYTISIRSLNILLEDAFWFILDLEPMDIIVHHGSLRSSCWSDLILGWHVNKDQLWNQLLVLSCCSGVRAFMLFGFSKLQELLSEGWCGISF